MTTRGRSRDPGMNCLTLTFSMDNVGRSVTGQKPKKNSARTPGYAPQPRSAVKSSRKYGSTARQHSANFYQRKLNDDIEKLLIEDDPPNSQPSTPRLPASYNKPLSARNSPKAEYHAEYLRLAQSLSLTSPLLTARASSSVAPQSFLIDDLQNRPCTDISDKLGRPTRTTLLRNRQRSNSAPIAAYETREEIKRRNQLLLDQRQNIRPGTAVSNKDTYVSQESMEGESLHAFLTGARYNRAHYVDAKSLMKYGVYMPRGNPHACFVNENKPRQYVPASETSPPAAPPESPVSDILDNDEDELADDLDNVTPAPPCTPAPQTTPSPQTPLPPRGEAPPTEEAPPSQARSSQQTTPSQQSVPREQTSPSHSRPRSSRSSRQAWGESSSSLGHTVAEESATESHLDRHKPVLSGPGPKLNITGRKLNFGGPPRPQSATSHPYDSESVPPPPPSIDMSTRLDLHGFSASRGLRAHALSDHARSVRFSEPDDFSVTGRGLSSPKSSPKHSPKHSSRSILKTDEVRIEPEPVEETVANPVVVSDSVVFFMTEEPDKQDEPVAKEEEVPMKDNGDGDLQPGENYESVKEDNVIDELADVTKDDDDVADDVMAEIGVEWMQAAGVVDALKEEEEELDDEERVATPSYVTAVDIAMKPAES